MSADSYDLNEHWEVSTVRDETNSLSLRYGIYRPDSETPADKYIVLLNGRTEYLEKYNYFVSDLQLPPNCHLISMDHRGQGASGGARGHIDSYDTFAKDASRIIDQTTAGKPFVILAHSMGGLIALYGALNGYIDPKKMLLFSPLLGLRDNPMPRTWSRPISRAIASLGVGHISAHFGQNNRADFPNNKLTHSTERYSRIQNAPHQIPSVTFGWVYATFLALDKIYDPKRLSTLTADVTILGSPDDRVVDETSWHRWTNVARKVCAKKIEFELVHGAKHELLSEIPNIYEYVLTVAKRFIREWTGT
jgi:lysophospholipase